MNTLQKRYEGFLSTPCLWKNDDVYLLNQFHIEPYFTKINIEVNNKLRLILLALFQQHLKA